MPFAEPRVVANTDSCWFYHTMDLPGTGLVEGHWDLRGRLNDYLGGVALNGRRVLDVGTASGFLSFGMEQEGAQVTSFDTERVENYNVVPFWNNLYTLNYPCWREETSKFLEKLRNSYWFAYGALNSACERYEGDVYDIPEEVGQFDVVVVGQILVHLRDPLAALASVAKRCRHTLVIAEGMDPTEVPLANFHPRFESHGPDSSWWQYSRGLYSEFLQILGFKDLHFTSHDYRCNAANANVEITTVVANRR